MVLVNAPQKTRTQSLYLPGKRMRPQGKILNSTIILLNCCDYLLLINWQIPATLTGTFLAPRQIKIKDKKKRKEKKSVHLYKFPFHI